MSCATAFFNRHGELTLMAGIPVDLVADKARHVVEFRYPKYEGNDWQSNLVESQIWPHTAWVLDDKLWAELVNTPSATPVIYDCHFHQIDQGAYPIGLFGALPEEENQLQLLLTGYQSKQAFEGTVQARGMELTSYVRPNLSQKLRGHQEGRAAAKNILLEPRPGTAYELTASRDWLNQRAAPVTTFIRWDGCDLTEWSPEMYHHIRHAQIHGPAQKLTCLLDKDCGFARQRLHLVETSSQLTLAQS